ncbi:hypothetical protein [Micavibrio aeruginosavorus]|uniref:DUF4139 domain-containing protein n=1 Tax=Micavibrio aeruginosavorus EPB TaxID=349215 RepID=M4VFK0_9BACT|nr:hypothetical protein [Micavibrio aeruginosavorus]AGH98147.1 hypothetical protein A11S_1338 [Micavibrio aeruginosavorus EPB]
MTKLRFALLASALFMATPAFADELPLKRAVISTSGVALYEHAGTIEGNADIALPVRLDQVDDALKSLVVFDTLGTIGGVNLPGRQPLAEAFRDLPFTQADLQSPVTLLNALKGAQVSIDGGITGRLIGVTTEAEKTDAGTITRHRVTVMGDTGMKSAIMENLNAVQFTEKAVQDQINRALEAVYTNRVKDQRTLNVTLNGEGKRDVALAYLQAAPLWKSTYRLVLPNEGGEDQTALIQGWAVLENTTGQDWNDVAVTITSGSPVTYTQALYESYYIPRTALPVKVIDRVMPRVDDGTVGTANIAEGKSEQWQKKAMRAGSDTMMESHMLATAAAPAPAMAEMAMDSAAGYGGAGESYVPAISTPDMAATQTALAAETATQMLFTFPTPVTLPAGDSLMVPFISEKMDAQRLYVYQPETNAAHPLAAVKVKNDGDTGLPPGILTLFDGGAPNLVHVGDAEMPLIPAGEDRFISFALDTKTNIEQKTEDDRQLGLITISNGTFTQKVSWRNTTTYTAKAPANEDREIVIEHPRRDGWDLIMPDGYDGKPDVTSTHYRLVLNVKKGESESLEVTLRRDDAETMALTYVNEADLDARMAAMGKDLPDDLRKAMDQVKTLRAAVAEQETALRQIENTRNQIYTDQERLRQNLETVAPNNKLGKRYLKQLEEQENALDKLASSEAAIEIKLNDARKALNDYIATLKF